jgi:hypothetical protein
MKPLFYNRILGSVAAAGLATLGMISGAHASVAFLPGSPATTDPFMFNFDENGTATYNIYDPTNNSYGPAQPAMTVAGAAGLIYILPQPVVPGNVKIGEPGSTNCSSATSCSDVLSFVKSGTTYEMIYYSQPGGGAVADIGLPAINYAATAFGAAENSNETFTYVAGVVGVPGVTNFYNGVSGVIPETSTWAMMLLGFAGLGFAGYRTSREGVSITA